eukprot:5015667-Lingulodinium_polyedra.AAC.1
MLWWRRCTWLASCAATAVVAPTPASTPGRRRPHLAGTMVWQAWSSWRSKALLVVASAPATAANIQ